MLRELFTTALSCAILPSLLTAANLVGTVTDADGKAVPSARIQVEGKRLGTLSNPAGTFTLANLADGPYSITVTAIGYAKKTVAVTLPLADTLRVRLEPRSYLSGDVVVTGSRADEQTPVSATTVQAEEIQKVFVGQDAAFVLSRTTPSLISYSESGTGFSNYGQFRLRGIDQTRVNITLNGVPLNDMIDQGVFFSNFTDFANSVQSVQVQRGVGTSANGTASFAGSIDFRSADLSTAKPKAELQLSGGSFGTIRTSAEIYTGKQDNGFSWYAKYSAFSSDGYREHSGTDAWSFFLSGEYATENHLFKLTGFSGRTASQLAYIPVQKSVIEQNPRANPVWSNDRDDFGQQFLQLQHTAVLSEKTTLTSSVYYGGAGGDFPFGYPLNDEATLWEQINYPLRNDHFGAQSTADIAFTDDIRLVAGAHLMTFRRENRENIVPYANAPYYRDKTVKDEVSGFAKMYYTAGSFTFFGDIQLRNVVLTFTPDTAFLGSNAAIPSRSWLFFNPRVGATYSFTPQQEAFVSFGRTSREPTRFDILGGVSQINTDNLASVQNQNSISPETVNDVELGYRHRSSSFEFSANAFAMFFQNEIAAIGERIQFVQLRKNAPSSRRVGLEAEWNLQLTPWLGWSGNATLMDASVSEFRPQGADTVYRNVRPVLTPSVMAATEIVWTPLSDLSISANGRYVGEQFLELTNRPDVVAPSFFVAGATLRYRLSPLAEVSLLVDNVFDTRYYTYGEAQQGANGLVPAYFVQPPRNIFLTTRITL